MTLSVPVVLLALTLATWLLLTWWSRRQRARLGLGGPIIAADDSALGAPTLRSERLGLVGRCDQLLEVDGTYVPVEHKPRARRLQPSHILQVGALCLLIREVYGVRPPYGVVVLADGRRERVAFDGELERAVLGMMAEMRRLLAGEPPGPRWVAPRCRACGYRRVCWDDGEGVTTADAR